MDTQTKDERLSKRTSLIGFLIGLFLLSGSVLFALAVSDPVQAQDISQVVINEFMASNGQTIADEDGHFEDWIEIYNSGDQTVSLLGYGLSDDPEQPFRWLFPDVEITAGSYLLVWASGKDRREPGSPLHTNFSISAGGEPLLLTHSDEGLVDQIGPLELPRDISYGRQADGADTWYYFDQATPGSSNDTPGYDAILPPPTFSHQAGFYTEPFSLTLSTADPAVEIIFTLDGSLPDPDNLAGHTYSYKNQYPQNPGNPFGDFLYDSYQSHSYSSPIAIVDRAGDADKLTGKSSTYEANPTYFPQNPVFKGMVVRAQALRDGALPSPVTTHTFFVTPDGRERYSLPVISLSIREDGLFDYYDGIYTAGVDFDEWRLANPVSLPSGSGPANWRRNTEYIGHFEFFEPGSQTITFGQDIGIRIHGGWGRSWRVKSLRLYARSGYGESTFAYSIFPDQPYTDYRRLILRNSGNDYDSTLYRDAAIQTIVAPLNFDTQAYRPAVVFINGEYWGIHNIRERYDRHYLAQIYGVDADNLDILEHDAQVKEGDALHYNAMLSYIQVNDLSLTEHYDYIQTQMDIINFADYQIAQIFARNTDWPHNNIDYWRLRTGTFAPHAPHGHDGRWRWLMFDTDFGFGRFGGSTAYAHNTLAWATAADGNGRPWSTVLLRALLENETFAHNFINRFADLLNTTFQSDRMVTLINTLKQPLEPAVGEHTARWGVPINWHNHVHVMIDFANERPYYQRQHIQEYFGLAGQYTLTAAVSDPAHGYIRVNTIDLLESTSGVNAEPYPWSGIYFQGVPVELEAISTPGYAFAGWVGLPDGTPALTEQTFTEDVTVTALFTEAPQTDTALIHYWFFGSDLPNDTPLTTVASSYSLLNTADAFIAFHSALDGYPFDNSHPNWRKASMERRNAPTEINYRPEGNNDIPFAEANMRGLQIKQPFAGDGGENTLVLHLPTTGFEDVVLRFAAVNEDAADSILVAYSTVSGTPQWTMLDPLSIFGAFQLYTLDFSAIEAANDNPDFKVRLRFAGDDMAADDGDRVTFNNISLDGSPLPETNLPPNVVGPLALQELVAAGDPLAIDLETVFEDPDDDPLTFQAESGDENLLQTSVSGNLLTLTALAQGEAWVTVWADDGYNEPVPTGFRVLVYPAAHPLSDAPFIFTAWNPDLPERAYPNHMLFLQSDVNDPALTTPLLYAYFIPHDDYHANDQDTIGFPYNNTGRTRLNGLGEDGISFINTGRSRDLGGALVALDTRNLAEPTINWLAGTILQNDRDYAIRLQYRLDITAPFTDVLVAAEPVEYLTGADGETQTFNDIPLPAEAQEQPYVQLLWRYYYIEGESGPRAQLRLDDIFIGSSGIVELPAAGFASNSPIMVGETAVFTNTTTGTAPLNYEWDFGDGSPVVTGTNPVHLYGEAGSYTVTLTAANAGGSDMVTGTVVVAAIPPAASFASNSPIMVGETAVFTNTTTGTAPLNYEWDFGDGSPVVTGTNPVHLYGEAGSYTVTLTAANAADSSVYTAIFSVEPTMIYLPIVVGDTAGPRQLPLVTIQSLGLWHNRDHDNSNQHSFPPRPGLRPFHLSRHNS